MYCFSAKGPETRIYDKNLVNLFSIGDGRLFSTIQQAMQLEPELRIQWTVRK